jgi:hypothetical protein
MQYRALVLPFLFATILLSAGPVTSAIADEHAKPPQRMSLEDCPPQWRRVIGLNTYCLLGEPYYADHLRGPVIVDMRHGAPIALPADEDAARVRSTAKPGDPTYQCGSDASCRYGTGR